MRACKIHHTINMCIKEKEEDEEKGEKKIKSFT